MPFVCVLFPLPPIVSSAAAQQLCSCSMLREFTKLILFDGWCVDGGRHASLTPWRHKENIESNGWVRTKFARLRLSISTAVALHTHTHAVGSVGRCSQISRQDTAKIGNAI